MEPPPASNPIPGAIVVGKTYDLVLWIVQKVEKFPKSYRFSVGQRLIDAGLDLLLLLVEAAYRRDKRDALRTASVRTNALRYLLRLAHDLKLLPMSAYAFATEHPTRSGGWWAAGSARRPAASDPKPRVISAAPFRDRVVHHALTSALEPHFERRFVGNSYACRTGYGTHRALDRACAACRRFRYALKCDIVRYFPSIDHAILREQLARVVACRPTLDLAARIIERFELPAALRADPIYFAGDTLFTPAERRRGLPLGNQTSQFFANVYLDPFDHFVVRRLRPGCYVRYVDDLLLFGDDPERLSADRQAIVEWLARLRLLPHPRKTRVFRVRDGITFLGWRVFDDRSRLVRPAVVRFRRRLRWMQRQYAAGHLDPAAIRQRVHAWLGHAAWATRGGSGARCSGLLCSCAVRGHRPGWFAAGPGTTTRRTCGCRTATTTRQTTATTISGFAVPGRWNG